MNTYNYKCIVTIINQPLEFYTKPSFNQYRNIPKEGILLNTGKCSMMTLFQAEQAIKRTLNYYNKDLSFKEEFYYYKIIKIDDDCTGDVKIIDDNSYVLVLAGNYEEYIKWFQNKTIFVNEYDRLKDKQINDLVIAKIGTYETNPKVKELFNYGKKMYFKEQLEKNKKPQRLNINLREI